MPTICASRPWSPRAKGHPDLAQSLLHQAQKRAPEAARAYVLLGQLLTQGGDAPAAFEQFNRLLSTNPPAFNLVAMDYAQLAQGLQRQAAALQTLSARYEQAPSMPVLRA